MNFEWHTVDAAEGLWQDEDRPREGVQEKGRPWHLVLAVLALAVAAGFFVWQGAQERMDAAAAQVEADARSSYELGQRAAQRRDRELFLSVLSGGDPRWTDAQEALLQEGMLFDEAGQLFGLEPLSRETETVTATVSPDLGEVVLYRQRRFRVEGEEEAARLQQPLVFRPGAQRWLLSPPARAFWGAWQRREARFVTLIYPERDAGPAVRLLSDLDETLAAVCSRLPELACPPDFHLTVRLESDPDSLLALNEGALTLSGGRWLELPAPSLVGRPANAAGYRALRRGYASATATAAIAALTDYDCCQHVLFMQAAVDWQLSELDMQPWPLNLERYVQVVDYLGRSTQLRQLWFRSRLDATTVAERWQAHTLVELLLTAEGGASSAAALQRGVIEAGDVVQWLRLTTSYPDLSAVYDAWRPLLFERVHALQEAAPLPEEDVVLACRTGERFEMQRYDPGTGKWSPVTLNADNFYMIIPLPGDASAVLSGWQRSTAAEPTVLWRAGETIPLRHPVPGRYFIPAVPMAAARMMDPRGQYLAVWVAEPGNFTSELVLLDLESCQEGECRWRPAPGIPLWSPSGARLLAARNGKIWLGRRGEQMRIIADGRSPFWLDGATYGYLSGDEIVVAGVEGDRRVLRVEVDFLLAEAAIGGALTVNHVVADPAGSGTLVLFGEGSDNREKVVVLLQRPGGNAGWMERPPQAGNVTVIERTADTVFGPRTSSFSPDGRWLTVQVAGEDWTRGEFLIYDLLRRQVVARPRKSRLTFSGYFPAQNYDWTANGRWLARWADGHIDLIAPEYGSYRRFVKLPPSLAGSRNCPSLAWIREE